MLKIVYKYYTQYILKLYISLYINLQLCNATSDEEVKELLMNEEMLDILSEIGYRGIPQRQTLSGVEVIVQ